MTYPKNKDAAEDEAELQEDATEVLAGKHTCHSSDIAFDVPHSTLYYRVKYGKKPQNQAHEDDQDLTHVEEKELV